MPKPRRKRCAVCNTLFDLKYSSLQKCCSPKCAIEHARTPEGREMAKKAWAQVDKSFKKKVREHDKPWWTKKAQEQFNKFIRLRDKGQPCISCGKMAKKANAGHFKSRGAHPQLRFHEDNCHLQCEPCNSFKSGNAIPYREALIKKIGQERVDWLESTHKPAKYSIEDLKAIRDKYKQLCEELG